METQHQADRLAIAKALALIQYLDDCPPFLEMFMMKESPEFQEAAEAIRSVVSTSADRPECSTCFGTGKINGGLGTLVTCSMCNGSGIRAAGIDGTGSLNEIEQCELCGKMFPRSDTMNMQPICRNCY